MEHTVYMGFFEKFFAAWRRSKILKMGTAAVGFLILILIINSVFAGKKNTVRSASSGPAAASVSLPVSSGEEELPDLAETIARLSRETNAVGSDREAFVEDFWRWIFGEAGLPERLSRMVAASALESPAFIMELLALLENDSFLYYLVDKKNSLPENYEPSDLVPLTGSSYRRARDGLELRRMAADSLDGMAASAGAEGIVLTIGSAYRSAEYQAQVYEREVRTYGRETADRQSARPGHSQHQLGLVVDFSPIDDAFAKTEASRWLLNNAGRFGWSLSYPDGYEEVTGYRWESWHYRYVGRDLAAFIENYFEGIQQYALQFINAWLGLADE